MKKSLKVFLVLSVIALLGIPSGAYIKGGARLPDPLVGDLSTLNVGGGYGDTGLTIDSNGNLLMNGKLTVDGLIDPTGLILSPQATTPLGAGNGIWIDNSGDNNLRFSGNAKIEDGKNLYFGTGSDGYLTYDSGANEMRLYSPPATGNSGGFWIYSSNGWNYFGINDTYTGLGVSLDSGVTYNAFNIYDDRTVFNETDDDIDFIIYGDSGAEVFKYDAGVDDIIINNATIIRGSSSAQYALQLYGYGTSSASLKLGYSVDLESFGTNSLNIGTSVSGKPINIGNTSAGTTNIYGGAMNITSGTGNINITGQGSVVIDSVSAGIIALQKATYLPDNTTLNFGATPDASINWSTAGAGSLDQRADQWYSWTKTPSQVGVTADVGIGHSIGWVGMWHELSPWGDPKEWSEIGISDGKIWLNDTESDTDTRISGDTISNLFYLDSGMDQVNIATAEARVSSARFNAWLGDGKDVIFDEMTGSSDFVMNSIQNPSEGNGRSRHLFGWANNGTKLAPYYRQATYYDSVGDIVQFSFTMQDRSDFGSIQSGMNIEIKADDSEGLGGKLELLADDDILLDANRSAGSFGIKLNSNTFLPDDIKISFGTTPGTAPFIYGKSGSGGYLQIETTDSNAGLNLSTGSGSSAIKLDSAGALNLWSQGNLSVDSALNLSFNDQWLSSAINLSQSGTTGLSGFTATSIVAALNELNASSVITTGSPATPQMTYFSGADSITGSANFVFATTNLGQTGVTIGGASGLLTTGASVYGRGIGGGWSGLSGHATANSSTAAAGVIGRATTGTGDKYGGYFLCTGGTTRRGVYTSASGGTTNWALEVGAGNVLLPDNVQIVLGTGQDYSISTDGTSLTMQGLGSGNVIMTMDDSTGAFALQGGSGGGSGFNLDANNDARMTDGNIGSEVKVFGSDGTIKLSENNQSQTFTMDGTAGTSSLLAEAGMVLSSENNDIDINAKLGYVQFLSQAQFGDSIPLYFGNTIAQDFRMQFDGTNFDIYNTQNDSFFRIGGATGTIRLEEGNNGSYIEINSSSGDVVLANSSGAFINIDDGVPAIILDANSAGGDITFRDQYLSAAIPLSESGTTGLTTFSATSIIGGMNELKGELIAESLWNRSGTTLNTQTANDSVLLGATGAANAAAILQSDSTTKGWLSPRMTSTQRDAISTPPAGLLLYDATNDGLNFYNGTAWRGFLSSPASTLISGSVLFATGMHHVDDDHANFCWDNTNKRLGLGTDTPTTTLHVEGNARISGSISNVTSLSMTGNLSSDGTIASVNLEATGVAGIGTFEADASAVLDATSTTKGFLPPRMTTAQRDAIGTPANGLMVYNTDQIKPNYYNGSVWKEEEVYGQDYQMEISTGRSTTTSSTFQDKVTLVTPTLTGTYEVTWCAVVDNNKDVSEYRLYNSTDATAYQTQIYISDNAADRLIISAFTVVTFSSQTKTFVVQWRNQAGGTEAGITDGCIKIKRVQ